MGAQLRVYKNRTNILPVSFGIDVSEDILTSEIRSLSGELIATWVITFTGDGTDGETEFKLDNSAVSGITHQMGLMDVKRVTGGEPIPVWEEPLEVIFVDSVTV